MYKKTKKMSIFTRLLIATIFRNKTGHTNSNQEVDGEIKLVLHTFLGDFTRHDGNFWYVKKGE